MSTLQRLPLLVLCLLLLGTVPAAAENQADDGSDDQWIISSGAFSNLPPGSLVSFSVAVEREIPAVKLDLVLSKDDQVMVLADPLLNRLGNVAQIYPERAREDGSYYSFDFTREELKRLLHKQDNPDENLNPPARGFRPGFPIIALDEALGYLGLIRPEPVRKPVIICEIRKGWLHRQEGKELARSAFKVLNDFHARSGAKLFLASYDPEELRQLAEEHNTGGDTGIELMQLIDINDGSEVQTLEFGHYQPYNYDLLFTKFGLKAISTYAAAIGFKPQTIFNDSGENIRSAYLEDAKTLGVKIVLYGETADLAMNTGQEPSSILEDLFVTVGFDAVLTDNAELINAWQERTGQISGKDNQDNSIERLIKQIEAGSAEQPDPPVQSGTTW